ncbi:squalene/phytoene synthase family protein [Streptomyces sp. NBC_00190]|uniref:squalene/phytoene synthase family protein n=1 Tax=unclassified Streptomyces TaxID=2593676 RepID=UPI002E29A5C1|nr:squalene/phytoene synthase family protein [Streptomyces sp. NBC_00190]WSZ38028.1 squalene/phytoene synthase family protein [Streptomyces sp. NBC_00868]
MWSVIRLLAPPEFQPHVLAGGTLLAFTDDVCDRGPASGRRKRFDLWADRVQSALDSGTSSHPLLRAYLHSAQTYGLPRHWADAYFAGTRIDLDFPGFADEDDYQRYVDTLTWPGLMLSTGLTPHLVSDEDFAASCRLFADGFQRADFLTDLAEDVRGGRLALPLADLARYGLSRADLEEGQDTPGLRCLILATALRARASLTASERTVGEVHDAYRPLVRCLIGLYHHRLDRVTALGSAVARRPVRDNPLVCLRLLARSNRPAQYGRHDTGGGGTSAPARAQSPTQ